MEYWEDKREDEVEKILDKIMAENFAHLARDTDVKIQEA